VHSRANATAAPLSADRGRPAVVTLQRRCTCGRRAAGRGHCEACRHEQERGRLGLGRGRALAPPIVHDVLQEPGAPLDRPTRRSVEAGFARDFSHVRVHADERAADSAGAVGADAYTVGSHIVFGGGRYAPATNAGRRLLAHELAHTVQQSGGWQAGADLSIRDDAGDERAAESAATDLLDGRPARTLGSGSVAVQRQDGAAAAARPAADDAQAPQPAAASACVQPQSGGEIEALLQSRAVTVIEFTASWCGPCGMLGRDLDRLCSTYSAHPPAVPIRFFSVDVDDPANARLSRQYSTVPHLLIYVGGTLHEHIDFRPEFEITQRVLANAIDHAARSGAARGAATGAKIGAIAGGIGGLATGIGLAFGGVLTGGLGLLGVFGLAAGGALLGAGLGAAIGAFAGWLTDSRDIRGGARRGAFEADALIRKRFGNDIPRGTAPLHGAPVRAVPQAELRALWLCRHSTEEDPGDGLVGWTDSGPFPPKPGEPAPPADPVCASGRTLEHATAARPVIYYASDRPDATVVIHEGLHAYEHDHFASQVRNRVSEAVTEYFTRKISSEIGATNSSAYENWLPDVEALVGKIGEPALRAAYFRGDFAPANRVLGNCGLERWAQALVQYMDRTAAEVLAGPPRDHCADVIRFPDSVAPASSEAHPTGR
jgi:thiol-disulfide isomerase/thioredoxin